MSTDIDLANSVTLVTTAETPVAVFNFAVLMGNNPVTPVPVPTRLSGVALVNTGASATTVVIRARQGVGTGGSSIGSNHVQTVAASSSYVIPFRFLDPAGASAYTITIQQTGASGNGTVLGSFNADQNLVGMD